jgi:hypothetical protein
VLKPVNLETLAGTTEHMQHVNWKLYYENTITTIVRLGFTFLVMLFIGNNKLIK